MNVEIGAEAALFPEKEYISGLFLAVYVNCYLWSANNVSEPHSYSMKYKLFSHCNAKQSL
jgi:hypothetical protein